MRHCCPWERAGFVSETTWGNKAKGLPLSGKTVHFSLGSLSLTVAPWHQLVFFFMPGKNMLWVDRHFLHDLTFCTCQPSLLCWLFPFFGGCLPAAVRVPADRWILSVAPHLPPPGPVVSALKSHAQFCVTRSYSDSTLGRTCPLPVKGVSCHLCNLQQDLGLSLNTECVLGHSRRPFCICFSYWFEWEVSV